VITHEEIQEICQKTDELLWDAFSRSLPNNPSHNQKGHLIFPYYNKANLRVSEQEARFLFAESISNSSLFYSIEAPTIKTYKFIGESLRSASTDLALYTNEKKQVCNVEFKAKGVSEGAINHLPIYKDLQKLLREKPWGLWFHLLKNTDNSTINNLLNVIGTKICSVRDNYKDLESQGLIIHICVLNQKFSLHRDLNLTELKTLSNESLCKKLTVDYSVTRHDLKNIVDINGWTHKRGS
jgi:hypothetical protein